ncbi:MAG: hypothetical protein WC383_10500 [Gammaproteobacteria bacterium]
MYVSFARSLLALPLMLAAAVVTAAPDGHSLYMQIAPQLANDREQLHTACKDGNPQACESLQSLDKVMTVFQETDNACQAGNSLACRDLGVGIGILVVGSRCHGGDTNACAQMQQIQSLAPDCDEGNADACREIEFALFGEELPAPPPAQGTPPQPPANGPEGATPEGLR